MGNHRKTIGKLWERHGITTKHGIAVENQSVVPHQNNCKCRIPSSIYTYIYICISGDMEKKTVCTNHRHVFHVKLKENHRKTIRTAVENHGKTMG